MSSATTPLIEARGLSAGYGSSSDAIAISDIDLVVRPGEVVALLGANGAGKTTTLLTMAGVLKPFSGEVYVGGQVSRAPLHRRARDGMAYVPEERSVFSRLTTAQNMAIARSCDIDKAVALFPALAGALKRRGGLLSGGEQQMLALARALSRPTTLLMADELSLGLAPIIVGSLLAAVRSAADEGMGALVVEQHVHRVLQVADRVYVLRQGRVQFAGSAAEARSQLAEIQRQYLASAPPPEPHDD